MKPCVRCRTENLDTSKFCKQCGNPLPQGGGKACPSGRHIMDAAWTECVYCKSDKGASSPRADRPVRTPTVYEGPTSGRAAPVRPPAYKVELPPALVSNENVRPVVASNVVAPAPPHPVRRDAGSLEQARNNPLSNPSGASFASRPTSEMNVKPEMTAAVCGKIVGVLVTYSWNPKGQIYPLREGRNIIGRDKDCEISIPEDQTLSSRHSHITYIQNFVVGDLVSESGTDVDGLPVEQQALELKNYATIRVGSTQLTFIALAPLGRANVS
jgi:Inner membrane component of T3SS, cytoplasmic domain